MPLARLRRDRRGAAMVEFALVVPVLAMTLLGLFDIAYNLYTTQQLQGAIQQAARKSTIEGAGANAATIDAVVSGAVHAIVPGATLSFSRESYTEFSNVSRAEDFTDINHDGVCDNGEPFTDVNGNGVWDRDTGTAGFGSARDAVLYTVNVTYPRALPIAGFIPGMPATVNMTATTVLRNQPYALQNAPVVSTGTCP